MASYLLKASDRDMDGWKDAARRAGVSFADWLRAAASAAALAEPEAEMRSPIGGVVSVSSITPGSPSAAKRKRTGLCPHRRSPDEFCSRCDA